MKKLLLFLLVCVFGTALHSQSTYDNPLGFTFSFDKTWKRLPKEVLYQKLKDVKALVDYKKDVHFEACYQKIGNADMDYPYILFKNIHGTTTSDAEIEEIKAALTNQQSINKAINNLINGKFGFDMTIGNNYYDLQNRILFITSEAGLSIKGNLVMLMAIYFGKNASVGIYCYSYKDEFKYDQKEFLDVIYSVKDN